MRDIKASVAGGLTPVEIGERIRYRGRHLFIFREDIKASIAGGLTLDEIGERIRY